MGYLRTGSGTSVSGGTPGAVTRHGGNGAVCVNLADARVAIEIDVSRRIDGHYLRIHLGGRGLPAIPGIATGARAGDGGNAARRGYLADGVAVEFLDIEIAGSIRGDGLNARKPAQNGWTTVSVERRNAAAGDGADDASRSHLADAPVAGVGDVQVAR